MKTMFALLVLGSTPAFATSPASVCNIMSESTSIGVNTYNNEYYSVCTTATDNSNKYSATNTLAFPVSEKKAVALAKMKVIKEMLDKGYTLTDDYLIKQ